MLINHTHRFITHTHSVAMCFVGSLYALAMSFCLFVDWLRQVWQITVGVTWADSGAATAKTGATCCTTGRCLCA